MAFFNTAGTEELYSGVEINRASAAASLARKFSHWLRHAGVFDITVVERDLGQGD